MNETIAFRPEGRASIKDVVVNYTLASLDELEQLHPALNLLAHPSIVRGSHDFFVRCYDAGVQHAQAGAAETVAVLPDSLPQERQRSGLLCAAAGRLDALRQPLTHNRLCDPPVSSVLAWQMLTAKPAAVLYRAQHIAAGLPAAVADQHSHGVCLQQALLHLLAGRAILHGRGSRRSGCSGRAACWAIKVSLRL